MRACKFKFKLIALALIMMGGASRAANADSGGPSKVPFTVKVDPSPFKSKGSPPQLQLSLADSSGTPTPASSPSPADAKPAAASTSPSEAAIAAAVVKSLEARLEKVDAIDSKITKLGEEQAKLRKEFIAFQNFSEGEFERLWAKVDGKVTQVGVAPASKTKKTTTTSKSNGLKYAGQILRPNGFVNAWKNNKGEWCKQDGTPFEPCTSSGGVICSEDAYRRHNGQYSSSHSYTMSTPTYSGMTMGTESYQYCPTGGCGSSSGMVMGGGYQYCPTGGCNSGW